MAPAPWRESLHDPAHQSIMSDSCVESEQEVSSSLWGLVLDWLGLMKGASAAVTSASALRGSTIPEQDGVAHRDRSPVSQGAHDRHAGDEARRSAGELTAMGAMNAWELGTEKPLGMSSDLRLLASPPMSVGAGTGSPRKVNGFGTELGDDGAVACNARKSNAGRRSVSHCEC